MGRMGRTHLAHQPNSQLAHFHYASANEPAGRLHSGAFAHLCPDFGSQLLKSKKKVLKNLKPKKSIELNNIHRVAIGLVIMYVALGFSVKKMAPFLQYKFFFNELILENFDTIQGNLRVNTEALLFPPLSATGAALRAPNTHTS